MDSSQAGLVQKSPNWKHFSLSGVGMWGERMQEGTRGNREFTGESMPWVGGGTSLIQELGFSGFKFWRGYLLTM